MKTPVREREEVNEFLTGIFESASMTCGAIERIFVKYLKNWTGIEVKEDERKSIADIAKESYQREWKNSSPETHTYIEEACMKAGLKEGNKSMNAKLAQMAVPVIQGMLAELPRKKKLRILDIGAGDGDTTGEILELLHHRSEYGIMPSIIQDCEIITLEPAYAKIELEETDPETGERKESKIQKLAKRMRGLPVQPVWTPVGSGFESFMAMVSPRYFDVILSSAVMHHVPDPSYWFMMEEKLKTNGIVIFGDWYTNIFSHPALLVPTLRDLGTSDADIREYQNYFGISAGDGQRIESSFTPEQKKSLEHMRKYIMHLSKELARAGREKRERDSDLLLFEGHHAHADTIKAAEEAGFTADKGILSKHAGASKAKAPVYHMNPGSDISTVFMVVPNKKRKTFPPVKSAKIRSR